MVGQARKGPRPLVMTAIHALQYGGSACLRESLVDSYEASWRPVGARALYVTIPHDEGA
jgi:hypothetical protein